MKQNLDIIAMAAGAIFAGLLLSGLFALFTNWIISLITDSFPVTLLNWAITFAVLAIIKIVLNK